MNTKLIIEELTCKFCKDVKQEFAKRVGVKPSTVSSWMERDTMDYAKVAKAFPEVSSEWLLRCEGPMLRSGSNDIIVSGNNNIGVGKDINVCYGMTPSAAPVVAQPSDTQVPCITPEVARRPDLDIVKNYRNGSLSLQMVDAINRVGDYSCSYIVSNDAMAPDYKTSDYLALSLQQSKDVISGNPYVLDTRLGMVTRYCFESDDHQSLLCRSSHPDRYPDLTISKDDIYSVFIILGQLRLHL